MTEGHKKREQSGSLQTRFYAILSVLHMETLN